MTSLESNHQEAKNILGTPLQSCSQDPLTGYYRDGCCNTDETDFGSHTVCAVMTEPFLTYSKALGNDLSTSMPEYGFVGLKAGDQWCLCAPRWRQAYDDGVAPHIVLESTHEAALQYATLEMYKQHAFSKAL